LTGETKALNLAIAAKAHAIAARSPARLETFQGSREFILLPQGLFPAGPPELIGVPQSTIELILRDDFAVSCTPGSTARIPRPTVKQPKAVSKQPSLLDYGEARAQTKLTLNWRGPRTEKHLTLCWLEGGEASGFQQAGQREPLSNKSESANYAAKKRKLYAFQRS